jgi:hypothetical protein
MRQWRKLPFIQYEARKRIWAGTPVLCAPRRFLEGRQGPGPRGTVGKRHNVTVRRQGVSLEAGKSGRGSVEEPLVQDVPGRLGWQHPAVHQRILFSLGGQPLVLRQEFRRRAGSFRRKAGERCLVAVHRLQFSTSDYDEGGPQAGGSGRGGGGGIGRGGRGRACRGRQRGVLTFCLLRFSFKGAGRAQPFGGEELRRPGAGKQACHAAVGRFRVLEALPAAGSEVCREFRNCYCGTRAGGCGSCGGPHTGR